jgi:hypothetical protein
VAGVTSSGLPRATARVRSRRARRRAEGPTPHEPATRPRDTKSPEGERARLYVLAFSRQRERRLIAL